MSDILRHSTENLLRNRADETKKSEQQELNKKKRYLVYIIKVI